MQIYLNNKNIGDMGAKLIGNELKNNTDCISLWIYGNSITLEVGAWQMLKKMEVFRYHKYHRLLCFLTKAPQLPRELPPLIFTYMSTGQLRFSASEA